MQEADDLDVPPSLLCAINALTPRDSRTTHAFHAMVSNYSGPEAPQSIEYARGVIKEDEVVVEAIQRDFDERGDTREISVAADRDRKSTRLNSSHYCASRMPSSACTNQTQCRYTRQSTKHKYSMLKS